MRRASVCAGRSEERRSRRMLLTLRERWLAPEAVWLDEDHPAPWPPGHLAAEADAAGAGEASERGGHFSPREAEQPGEGGLAREPRPGHVALEQAIDRSRPGQAPRLGDLSRQPRVDEGPSVRGG